MRVHGILIECHITLMGTHESVSRLDEKDGHCGALPPLAQAIGGYGGAIYPCA